MLRRLAQAACGLAIAGGTSVASAQSAPLALDRFYPAPAGDRMFGAQSPYVAGELTPHAAIYADYAHNPLILTTVKSKENKGSIVSDQLFLHLNASLAIKSRLLINVDFPIALLQTGSDLTGPGYSFKAANSAEIGDLRAGLRLRILGEYWDPFQLAVGGYVWFPTGKAENTGSYVSDGSVRGLPQVIVGGRIGDTAVWSFDAGVDVRGGQAFGGVSQGTQVRLDGGIGFLLDAGPGTFQLGPEFMASFLVDNPKGSAIERTTNLEVMADARYRFLHDFEIGIGAGPGLSSGIGTPDVRVVGMAAYSPEMKKVEPPRDTDGDGIFDPMDACPTVKGIPSTDPAKNGCPILDTDGDGIMDPQDSCPTVKGLASPDPKLNGCPDTDGDGIFDQLDACPQVKGLPNADAKLNGCPDTDGDGIFDQEDACPQVPGVKNANPKLNGCADTDADGIFDPEDACPQVKGQANPDPKLNGCTDTDSDTIWDPQDACPNEKGKANPDPTKNGCPEAVRVTETEVIILQQVQFDTAKATIKKVSDPLLDEVAGVFKEHPELTKIEIQGHTDNKGSPTINKPLSQARAESVKKALIKRGIAEGRMIPKGYGPDKPIGDNNTDEGRQKNRRVQFVILEKVNKEGKTIIMTPADQPPTAGMPATQPPAQPATGKPGSPKQPAPKQPAPKAPAPKAPAPKPTPKAPAPKPKK